MKSVKLLLVGLGAVAVLSACEKAPTDPIVMACVDTNSRLPADKQRDNAVSFCECLATDLKAALSAEDHELLVEIRKNERNGPAAAAALYDARNWEMAQILGFQDRLVSANRKAVEKCG